MKITPYKEQEKLNETIQLIDAKIEINQMLE
jgi:hypothetical protein